MPRDPVPVAEERQRDADRSQSTILAAARDEFAEHGLGGARMERIAERADRLGQYACLFDEPERINTEDSRYEAVTAQHVQAAMASMMRPDNRVVLTYVPAEP
jgi:predicted Zn-dependent peptidase